MIFNKWKKRAYEERERNSVLEGDLIDCKNQIEQLYKVFKVMDSNPTCKHILDLRMEADIDNKPATKVYLTHEQQRDIYNDVGMYLTDSVGIQTVYGLRVFTTQKNMRVE
tara:strand:- start:14947 stop:15276 length:330 start_codon:yes stop_codon:yes gene_type:complete